MEQQYGDDFITITDEDGTNYELEVLSTLDYNGSTYLALCAADDLDSDEETDLEVSFLKVVEEDGEEILCAHRGRGGACLRLSFVYRAVLRGRRRIIFPCLVRHRTLLNPHHVIGMPDSCFRLQASRQLLLLEVGSSNGRKEATHLLFLCRL